MFTLEYLKKYLNLYHLFFELCTHIIQCQQNKLGEILSKVTVSFILSHVAYFWGNTSQMVRKEVCKCD